MGVRGLATALMALLALSGVGAAAVPDKKPPACAGKTRRAAIKAIAAAYEVVLDGTIVERTLDEKLALIEGADDPAFRTVLEDVAAPNAEALATTSVEIEQVTCTAKKTADVRFELVLDGEPERGLAPPGGAILHDDRWKLTQATVCNLVALADPTLFEAGPCADALATRT